MIDTMQFPRGTQPEASTAAQPGSKKWQCMLCSFIYDEARGMPEEGIAPGTPWEDVPESWTCSDCGVGKNEFEMMEI